jgi:hypothetical protein
MARAPSGPMGLRTGLLSALAPGRLLTGSCGSGPAHGPTIGASPHTVRATDAYGPSNRRRSGRPGPSRLRSPDRAGLDGARVGAARVEK